MSKARDIAEFAHIMAQESKLSFPQVWALVINARTLDRHNEAECSRPVSGREERRAEKAKETIITLLEGSGIRPVFGGDPRGAAVKLALPSGRYNSWGGEGWCVPV